MRALNLDIFYCDLEPSVGDVLWARLHLIVTRSRREKAGEPKLFQRPASREIVNTRCVMVLESSLGESRKEPSLGYEVRFVPDTLVFVRADEALNYPTPESNVLTGSLRASLHEAELPGTTCLRVVRVLRRVNTIGQDFGVWLDTDEAPRSYFAEDDTNDVFRIVADVQRPKA